MPRNPARKYRARTSLATGIAEGAQGVDREARVIRGYSVVTRGEAKGHETWIDETFLDQVVAVGNAIDIGLKSRFTHPGLCSDGLGKFLGRTHNLRRVDGRVVGDLHFAQAGSKSPDGDLAGYVMDLADEDPDAFGASIVFYHDIGAEQEFEGAHSDEDGKFTSPDPDNAEHYPHIRLAGVEASDVVDEPAANSGMFTRLEQGALVEQADRWADWALGQSDEPPDDVALGLGIESERAREWLHGYLDRRGLQVVKRDGGNGPASATDPPNEERTIMPDVQADPAKAGALETEGKKAATLVELKAKYGTKPDFVIAQLEAGASMDEAESSWKDVQLAEKDAEIARLTAEAEKQPVITGIGPLPHSGPVEQGAALSFYGLVEQWQTIHPGCSKGEAMIEISKRHPELADAVCMPAGVAVKT